MEEFDQIGFSLDRLSFGSESPMLEPEVLEELEKTLEEMKDLSRGGTPIIVEGKKDEEALRELGMEGPVHQIPSGGRTPLNSLEDLPEYEEIIVLTDFDRTGGELADFCEENLEKLGVTVLFGFRSKLKNYVRKGVKDIEGMTSFIRSEQESQTRGNSGFD